MVASQGLCSMEAVSYTRGGQFLLATKLSSILIILRRVRMF